MFQGADKFNAYAEFLRTMGTPLFPEASVLWIARLVLGASVALHVWSATSLTLANRRARSTDYELRRGVQLDYAARTMRVSGYLIALYIVFHLMHLTWGNAHHDFIVGNPYANLVSGFQIVPVALVYIAANLLLGDAPLPRPMELVSISRPEPSELQRVAAPLRDHVRDRDERRFHQHPGSGAHGDRVLTWLSS